MKNFKITILFIGLCIMLLCSCKKEDAVANGERERYEAFCNNLPSGSNIEYKLNNNKWETDCVLGISLLGDSLVGALSIYSYNIDGDTFKDDTEVLFISIPGTFIGVGTYGGDEVLSFFFKGLLQTISSQSENAYISSGTESDFIKIDSFDGNNIKGELNLSLTREEDGDNIQLTGSFDVTLQE